MDLKKLGKIAGDLGAKVDLDKINLDNIINDQFIAKNTKLDSVKAFIEQSGFEVSKITDLKNIPTDKLDEYVKKISSFSSWKELLMKAVVK